MPKPIEYRKEDARRVLDLARGYSRLAGNKIEYKALAGRHGVTQTLLQAETEMVLRAAAPKHEYFKGKPLENKWLYQRTANLVEALIETGAVSAPKLERAAARNLDRRLKLGFTERVESRVARLVNSLHSHIAMPEKRGLTRYKLLKQVMEKHGYDYKQMKDALYAIAYATLPGTVPPEESKRGKDARNAVATLKGKALWGRAETVAQWFVQHSPEMDLERIRELHPGTNEMIADAQNRWAKHLTDIAALHRERGVHPAAAYAKAWKAAGYKEHRELPANESMVRQLHQFAQIVEKGGWDKGFADRIGMSPMEKREALSLLRRVFLVTPRMTEAEIAKVVEKANTATWSANAYLARAAYHEEMAVKEPHNAKSHFANADIYRHMGREAGIADPVARLAALSG